MESRLFTYFTDANQNIQDRPLVSAVDPVTVRLKLETAGPVAVSTRSDLFPIGSGKGIQVPGDAWTDINLDPGQRLYAASNGANRLLVIVGPRDSAPQTTAAAAAPPQAPLAPNTSGVKAPPWPLRF